MKYRALRTTETAENTFERKIETLETENLPDNDVLIRVHYSSLNYKDALSASGHKGVTRKYPHTPGIDAAGEVLEDRTGTFEQQDKVLVTGYDLGMNTDGGFGECIRVPAEWVVPLPSGLSLEESMILGTAGFTAAIGIHKMIKNDQMPEDGPVLVSGATGGVGSLAIAILSKLGYNVVASTGKQDAVDYLKNIGASEVIHRSEADDQSGKPLVKPKWAGAFDTVGGNTLATAIKACKRHGNIATCGNVASVKLETTVFPFILNGVNLLGVDSATTVYQLRKELWQKLSKVWKPNVLEEVKTLISLEELDTAIQKILKGNIRGRIVIKHNE